MAERKHFSEQIRPRGPHLIVDPVKAENVRGTLARLWRYLRRDYLKLAGVGLLVVTGNLAILLGPWLQGRAIDQGILPGNLPCWAVSCW